jgi:hypothetical protein
MGSATVTWARGRKVYSANAEMKISFFAPARVGSELICTGTVVSGGSRAPHALAMAVSIGIVVAGRGVRTVDVLGP